MKKSEIIEILIDSPVWSGTKNKKALMKYSKEELQDALNEIEDAENEFYDEMY